jgi:hypothetical protein
MDNDISLEIYRKMVEADVALYADYHKRATNFDVFYKNMYSASQAISIFYNEASRQIFNSPGFDFYVQGFESGSLLNFVRPQGKKP